MMLGPRLQLKQSQQLVMTPQLQQAIKMLQMSSLDVAGFIADEVERNPLLSIEDAGGEAAAPAEAAPEIAVDAGLKDATPGGAEDTFDTGAENLSADADRLGPAGEPASAWSGDGRGGGAGGGEAVSLEDVLETDFTLRDHLLTQIAVASGEPGATALARYLVDELDEAGYLRADLEDLARRLGADGTLIAKAVGVLQACDPPGIGARSLAECLELQLRARNRFDPAMAALLSRLDDLAAVRLDRLRSACGVDDDDLREMIAELRALNPRPGGAFGAVHAQTVVPDVFVRSTRFGGWSVELNSDALPKVLLDTRYAETLNAAGESQAKSFVAECRQNADWLLRALDQRAQTILKVASEIVRRQSLFFSEGVSGLTPMTLRDVAEEIDMHESTVSRVTANKHISCGRGVFEMRFFFTQGLAATDGGEAVSARSVKERIKALIEKENPDKPLSDDKIVDRLHEDGVDIARRTVAKYRESMEIPSSARRKRLKAAALVR